MSPDEKIFPQFFKDAGYKTAMIGKWLLGFFQRQYTPYMRGFDSYLGHLGIYLDYYDHTMKDFVKSYFGHDMRRNLDVANYDGQYATDLFTNEAVNLITSHDQCKPLFLYLSHLAAHYGNDDAPLQAPQADIDRVSYISDPKKRVAAGW